MPPNVYAFPAGPPLTEPRPIQSAEPILIFAADADVRPLRGVQEPPLFRHSANGGRRCICHLRHFPQRRLPSVCAHALRMIYVALAMPCTASAAQLATRVCRTRSATGHRSGEARRLQSQALTRLDFQHAILNRSRLGPHCARVDKFELKLCTTTQSFSLQALR